MKYKPTSEDKKIIRRCAERDAGFKRVEICASTRFNVNDYKREHMNVCFVSDDPNFSDTDLADNSFKWSDFTKGVELTSDGRGRFDFWVYSTGPDAELQTNITIEVENGRLMSVEGTCHGVMWKATQAD